MKAISYSGNIKMADITLPQIRLYADSAISRDVMPLFIPDISASWHAKICVAVRVHRLGKNILPKFVMRYVDALGAVAVLVPSEDDVVLENSGVMQILDGAVTTGTWHEENIGALSELTVNINGKCRSFSATELDIANTVSLVSRYATLKTGDFIILESTASVFPLTRNNVIDVELASSPALHIKVK